MLSIVTFKWKPTSGYRSAYGPEQVHTLRNMVARHYPEPHRFICVTDDPAGLDDGVEVVPLWGDHADLPNPSFRDGPSCYRRLKVFQRGIEALLGDRFVCIDLDVVICGDLRPLLNRTEDFIAWQNPNPMWPYNGSLFMLTAGSRAKVWDSFNADQSPALSHAANCRGSDQGWMSYVLGPGEATWDYDDGVISYQEDLERNKVFRGKLISQRRSRPLPPHSSIVVFHGPIDPWMPLAQKLSPWIQEHYR